MFELRRQRPFEQIEMAAGVLKRHQHQCDVTVSQQLVLFLVAPVQPIRKHSLIYGRKNAFLTCCDGITQFYSYHQAVIVYIVKHCKSCIFTIDVGHLKYVFFHQLAKKLIRALQFFRGSAQVTQLIARRFSALCNILKRHFSKKFLSVFFFYFTKNFDNV